VGAEGAIVLTVSENAALGALLFPAESTART
jgi:hypothetical protein